MLDYEDLEKPRQLREEICRQHLQWMDVMSKQLDENYARHVALRKQEHEQSRSRRPADARPDR